MIVLNNRTISISHQRKRRLGFTLVELLVVVTIMIILSALTFSLINISMDSERLSNGANQVQTYLEGARDRAIHAGAPRGVRFILDRNTIGFPTVSSMIYIGPPEQYGEGRVAISIADKRSVTLSGAVWSNITTDGFLANGARIRINDETTFYTLVLNPATGNWALTRDFAGPFDTPLNYELELAPTELDRQDPSQFPRNIVIDLNVSSTPGWLSDTSHMDILFSPRGTVVGNAATRGIIHLLFSERSDVEKGYGIGNVNKEKGEYLITVVTTTGAVNKHPVDPTDLIDNTTGLPGPDGLADDPYRFAETGKEAK